jgi:hypothetical protein
VYGTPEPPYPIRPLVSVRADWTRHGNGEYDANFSSIWSKLINETGRWVEDYSSDLLISIDSLKDNLKEIIEEPTIHIFALRQSGVDGNTFYECRVAENKSPQDYYRRVFGVVIIPCPLVTDRDYYKDSVYIDLVDMTSDIYSHRKFMNEKNGKPWYN